MVIMVIIFMAVIIALSDVQLHPTFRFQQADVGCIRGKCLKRFFQPWCQAVSDPKHDICCRQPCRVTRPERKVMRIRICGHQDIRRAQISHHLGGQAVQWRKIGHNARHVRQRSGG